MHPLVGQFLKTSLRGIKRHMGLLERFGRYPARNELLGRVSTPEEVEFLESTRSGLALVGGLRWGSGSGQRLTKSGLRSPAPGMGLPDP